MLVTNWVTVYHMMTSSNGNIFRVTDPLCGEFTGPGEFPPQRPVVWSFDLFFDLLLNKRLSKQSWGWWFETPSCSLWPHCNDLNIYDKVHWLVNTSPAPEEFYDGKQVLILHICHLRSWISNNIPLFSVGCSSLSAVEVYGTQEELHPKVLCEYNYLFVS